MNRYFCEHAGFYGFSALFYRNISWWSVSVAFRLHIFNGLRQTSIAFLPTFHSIDCKCFSIFTFTVQAFLSARDKYFIWYQEYKTHAHHTYSAKILVQLIAIEWHPTRLSFWFVQVNKWSVNFWDKFSVCFLHCL